MLEALIVFISGSTLTSRPALVGAAAMSAGSVAVGLSTWLCAFLTVRGSCTVRSHRDVRVGQAVLGCWVVTDGLVSEIQGVSL